VQHFAQIARRARYAAMQPDAVAQRAEIAALLYHNPLSTFGMSHLAAWFRPHGLHGFWVVTSAVQPGVRYRCTHAVHDDFGNLVEVRQ